MFLHFPIYFNYTSLQFFLQIGGFGTVQFLYRPVAMQEGKALCKAPPFIKNEWLACHFFQKLLSSSQTPRAFQAKKWVRNASVPLRKTESFFCHLHLEKFSKNLLFQLKPKFKVKIIYFHIKRAAFYNCSYGYYYEFLICKLLSLWTFNFIYIYNQNF